MPRIATAHLLHGFLGVGKTTLALRLAERHQAVRFSPDDWMAALFGPDPSAETFAAHDRAIKAQLRLVWMRLLQLGVDVVLDYGFWSRAERDEVRQHVRAAGGLPRMYQLEACEALSRKRIAARNLAYLDGLQITASTYDALRARFEPLTPDEDAEFPA